MSDAPIIKPLPVKSKPKDHLTFTDGFEFGCGFMTAAFIFLVVVVPLISVGLAMFFGSLARLAGG